VTTRRQLQAARTRRDILDAARRLFAQRGYRRTTVAQVAEEAGVSVQTIYDSVGSKAALVVGLNDLIDELIEIPELAARIPAINDAVELVEIPIQITRQAVDRAGDIIRAVQVSGEPELEGVRTEMRKRHREGIRGLVQRLAALGGLPPEADQERSADVIAALADPEMWLRWLDGYGWTLDEVAAWTRHALLTLVVASDGD